jgi:anthranilate synthase/indole-3-glycerol phosphate synthase/phosphoribosylanthranilate isomerase
LLVDQILEARLAGADSVLLIVKMLENNQLQRLYDYSRQLGMEPLVEVNTVEEMGVARKLGALVIGVNNRNLTSFEVDLETTTRLITLKGQDTIIAALSGISGPNDVTAYTQSGVDAVLVGEALMRAKDTTAFVQELLGPPRPTMQAPPARDLLVKICGTRSPEAARTAIETGAHMIGIILVEGRKRCVDRDTALAISKMVHETQKPRTEVGEETSSSASSAATDFFKHTANFFRHNHRALLVGVFQDQPLEYILAQQKLLNLDVVQLHGLEPVEWALLIPVPVIRRFGPNDPGVGNRGYHALPLIDSASGGTGQKQDLAAIEKLLTSDKELRIILAGGLEPANLGPIVRQLRTYGDRLVAVDVSSGVEEKGVQSLERIRDFITAAKRETQV